MVAFKTTNKPQAVTHSFEKRNFPSLLTFEFPEGEWHDVGFNDLDPNEQEGLFGLCIEAGLTELPDYDPQKVLLVKAADGVMAEIYGPAIFRDGENIVLKIGANQIPLSQTGDRLQVGSLSGKLSIQAKLTVFGTEYPVATVSFLSPNKVIYRIRVVLDSNQALEVADLEVVTIGEDAKSLLPYLSPVPSSAMKMYQLGIGEFAVKAISSSDGQFGTSYKLHLAEGAVVWATGNSQIQMENPNFRFSPGDVLTLKITSIEQLDGGKFKVHNCLVKRLPRLGSPKSAEVKILEAKVQPVAVSSDPELESLNLDEISF
jgi:hypothetical protein